jgi:hypothetical protein
MIDSIPEYREAVLKAPGVLNNEYRSYNRELHSIMIPLELH